MVKAISIQIPGVNSPTEVFVKLRFLHLAMDQKNSAVWALLLDQEAIQLREKHVEKSRLKAGWPTQLAAGGFRHEDTLYLPVPVIPGHLHKSPI